LAERNRTNVPSAWLVAQVPKSVDCDRTQPRTATMGYAELFEKFQTLPLEKQA
jgi:hypothetical protein